MARERPIVVSTRANESEADLIHTAAKSAGQSVNAWALPVLLREARDQLRRQWLEPSEPAA
jgi:uncharacterized protein (DUF1778 family)